MTPDIPRRRGASSPYLELVPPRLHLFVPALMSVGFVFWVSALVRDQLRHRRAQSLERRAVVAGEAAAAITLGRRPPEVPPLAGQADRRLYLIASLPFIVLAVYVFIGGIGNYFRPGGYVSEIGWLLAVTVALSFAFASMGAVFGIIFRQWPELSPPVRRLAARTPIGALPQESRPFAEPALTLSGTLIATVAVAALMAMVVGSSRGFLSRFDEPLLDTAADAGWLGALSNADVLGSSLFAIMAAALLGVASLRCRALVVAYPFALVTAFATSNVLKLLVERGRPPGGEFAGEFDSFPSGHMVMTTILVGLLPLTVAVMVHSVRFIRPLRLVAVGAVIVTALHRVHNESHWPTDVVGGVLIGASIVLAVEWAIAHEAWHRRCTSCPWTPVPGHPVTHGTVPIHVDLAKTLGWVSHLSAAAVAILIAVLAVTRGLPADPDGILVDPAVQRPLQLGLAGLVSVGTLVSWRWPPLGAVMLAFAAGGLGTFAALQYEPLTALALTVLVTIPAVLLWLSWQHRRRHGEIVALAVTTIVLLLGTWVTATLVYASVFGPTHADSDAARLPVDHVEWVWLGGLGAESISVTARLDDDDVEARLVVTSGDQKWSTASQQATEADLVHFEITDLEPGQSYDYLVEINGEPDAGRGAGTFRTPAVGPASFRVVAGSCARVDSNAAVFDAIAAEHPLLYLALGDVHYSNIADNDVETFRIAYDRMLTQPGQAALYRDVPVSYVWDDHDYGPNDSDADSPSRQAARQAFREQVPSHDLVTDDGAIHRAYSIGRVRFVVTDTRSERRGDSMLGAEQLSWFEDEVVTASRTHALVVWMNPTPWIGEASSSGDGWAAFAEERRHIADTFAAANVENLLMISGDAHMLAFDDGTNSGYASDGSPGFPILHAAALDRPGNVKGGPYSGGSFPGFGQYGVIDIDDDGQTVEVQLTGKNWKGEILISERLSFAG